MRHIAPFRKIQLSQNLNKGIVVSAILLPAQQIFPRVSAGRNGPESRARATREVADRKARHPVSNRWRGGMGAGQRCWASASLNRSLIRHTASSRSPIRVDAASLLWH